MTDEVTQQAVLVLAMDGDGDITVLKNRDGEEGNYNAPNLAALNLLAQTLNPLYIGFLYAGLQRRIEKIYAQEGRRFSNTSEEPTDGR